jgi:hypothetical protein
MDNNGAKEATCADADEHVIRAFLAYQTALKAHRAKRRKLTSEASEILTDNQHECTNCNVVSHGRTCCG